MGGRDVLEIRVRGTAGPQAPTHGSSILLHLLQTAVFSEAPLTLCSAMLVPVCPFTHTTWYG
jgi:hypothetical protein